MLATAQRMAPLDVSYQRILEDSDFPIFFIADGDEYACWHPATCPNKDIRMQIRAALVIADKTEGRHRQAQEIVRAVAKRDYMLETIEKIH